MGKVTTVCFTITGECIQRVSRELILEDKWEQALALIKDGLEGITTDQAISVLKGEYQLTGDSKVGVNLIPEEDNDELETYKKEVKRHYAGRVKLARSDLWFIPYSVIKCFTAQDIGSPKIWSDREINLRKDRENDGFYVGKVKDKSDWAYHRAMYYANDPMLDRAYSIKNKDEASMNIVLFQVCSSRPFWMGVPKNAQEAVEELKSNGGYLREIPNETFIKDDDGKIIPKSVFDSYEKRPLACSTDKSNPLERLVPEELKHISSDLIKGVTGTHDDSSPIEVDPLFTARSGYVLKNGDFYGCGYMEHPSLVKRILIHALKESIDNIEDFEKEADKRSWLRIQQSFTKDINFCVLRKLTQAQIDTLFDFVTKHCIISDDFAKFIEGDHINYMTLQTKTEEQ
jgi:hypothetical protein